MLIFLKKVIDIAVKTVIAITLCGIMTKNKK